MRLDLRARQFGRLTPLEHLAWPYWKCRCECGVECEQRTDDLVRGKVRSCGCWKRELIVHRMTKHGMARTPEYKVWAGMIERCENPHDHSYKYYGARGIRICKRWRESFLAFLEDAGPRPARGLTIDRIINSLGYRPGNCRWATPKQQRHNQTPRTHCPRGHVLNDDNVYLLRGQRRCRVCRRMTERPRREQLIRVI